MEEYRPLAADGAAPDGQTRLPWGDETPTVTVETPAPVGIEAHPPEPITHFAAPEATFFTAEPPAHQLIDADENGHRDADNGEPDEPEEVVSEEPDDDVPADEAPAEPDATVDEDEAFSPPTVVDEELEPADWVDEPVNDVWSDDDAWAPPPALDAEDEDVWAPRAPTDVAEDESTEPLVAEAPETTSAFAMPPIDSPPVVEPPVAEPPAAEPPVAGDEIEAMLDDLLPSADDLAPIEERPAVAETLSPWAPAPLIEEPPVVIEEPPVVVEDEAEAVIEPEPEAAAFVEREPEPEPEVGQAAVIDEPVAEEQPPGEAPRMVSPSHPEWVEQERIVVDDAAPELEWADPESADFGLAADGATTTTTDVEDGRFVAPAASAPPAPVREEPPAPSEWFNPPEAEAEVDTDAAAAEWLTLPELDEQLAAVSESPPADDELPPMVGEDEPLAPVASSAIVTDFGRPPEQPEEHVDVEPDTTMPLPIEPAAREATIVGLPIPAAAPAAVEEPVLLRTAAAVPTRTLGIRRIAVVAAALVMGTLVVRQLNPSALSGPPTFVGVTSGEGSQTQSSRTDQQATAGSTNGSQHVAGGKTSTTVAGANGSTGTTTANGSTGTTVAGGKTGTTVAGGKTTPTTAAPPATTPASTAGYTTAKKACTDFNRAYVSRDNGGMTDDQADDVFVNIASETYPAYQANSAKWGPMYNHALTLQKQLEGTVDSTDQQIEDQISAVYNDCKTSGLI